MDKATTQRIREILVRYKLFLDGEGCNSMSEDEIMLFRMQTAFREKFPNEEEASKTVMLKAAAALRGLKEGGKKGGSAKTAQKAKAAAENGKKGGRPKTVS